MDNGHKQTSMTGIELDQSHMQTSLSTPDVNQVTRRQFDSVAGVDDSQVHITSVISLNLILFFEIN